MKHVPCDRLEARLWAKINKFGPIPENRPELGPCWIWMASLTMHGYGQFSVKRIMRGAHRVVYELVVGDVPSNLELDHLCRVRRCCNPSHLEPVTHKVNTLRGKGNHWINSTKTICKNGHTFDIENTYARPNGRRGCRACNAAAVSRYKARMVRT